MTKWVVLDSSLTVCPELLRKVINERPKNDVFNQITSELIDLFSYIHHISINNESYKM